MTGCVKFCRIRAVPCAATGRRVASPVPGGATAAPYKSEACYLKIFSIFKIAISNTAPPMAISQRTTAPPPPTPS